MDFLNDIVRQAREQKDSAAGSEAYRDRNIGTITLYANGFIIGNGEFRDAKVEKNAQFLADLKTGEVPAELEDLCRKEWGNQVDAVGVNLVDKTSETFKPKFDFAQSKGQSLAASGSAPVAASFATAKAAKAAVNGAAAQAAVQIMTADRKRIRETFNETHTVLDLYQHIMAITGAPPGFQIVAGCKNKFCLSYLLSLMILTDSTISTVLLLFFSSP